MGVTDDGGVDFVKDVLADDTDFGLGRIDKAAREVVVDYVGLWSFKVINASFFASFSIQSSNLSRCAMLADCASNSSAIQSLDFL